MLITPNHSFPVWSYSLHDTLSADPVDPAAFRKLMGQFATGVCVVSARKPDGSVYGITVNSLVSVSLDPVLVCWSLQNTSSQFDFWTGADHFAVSILAEDQRDVAVRYASRGDTAMQVSDFTAAHTGSPGLLGALGHLECRRWSLYPAGDHTMIFGEVVGMRQATSGKPLGFYGGEFCRIEQ